MSVRSDGDRILGSLAVVDGRGVARIEDRFETDIDDLWSAITDPNRLRQWHAQVTGNLREGGDFRMYLAADDWEGTGRIQVCEPPKHLLVTTRESDESWRKGQGVPPFDQVVDVALTADGDQTILVVKVEGMPRDTIAFYAAGWQIHAENLAAYVAGRERMDSGARFEALVPPYKDLAAKIP